jgi:Mechanosensitive ion channel, conserved TM helix
MNEAENLLSSLRITWDQILSALPEVLVTLVLLVAGWLLAKLLRRLALRFFRLIRLDEIAEKSGLDDVLVQGGVRYTTATLLAATIYWLFLFAVLLALLNSLGLQAASSLVDRIVLYLPNVILAVLILVFGTLLARFIGGLVYTYLNNIGTDSAEPISAVARYAMLVFVFSLAFEQLAIESQILVSAFQIAFGSICLALALAFGLGGREWAAHVLERFWKRGNTGS